MWMELSECELVDTWLIYAKLGGTLRATQRLWQVIMYATEKCVWGSWYFIMWDFRFSRRRVWSLESSGMYCLVVKQMLFDIYLTTRQYIPEDWTWYFISRWIVWCVWILCWDSIYGWKKTNCIWLALLSLISGLQFPKGAALAQAVWCLTTGWTTGRSGFDPRQGQRIFLYPLCPDQLWGPPSLLYNGYRGSFHRG
jgi:hypothetical protein